MKGQDIWRGRHKSLNDAIAAGVAGIGVDRILVSRALKNHDIKIVMVLVEEMRRIYLTPIEDFFNDQIAFSRTAYNGRSLRILPYGRFHERYLGPHLHTKRKRASA